MVSDPVLDPLLAAARHDPALLGVILHGSRGAGLGDEESDYDLVFVLTDSGYDRRLAEGLPLDEVRREGDRKLVEIAFTSPRRLRDPELPRWHIQGLAAASVVLDTTGEVTQLLEELTSIPAEKAREEAAEHYDGYLNGFYRSMKAARRGDELGTRLQAAESMTYLIRTLFALESRWPPFHDRAAHALDRLDGQGWESGELRTMILEVLRTAAPEAQLTLEERVECVMGERGYGHVVEAWDGEIERVKRR